MNSNQDFTQSHDIRTTLKYWCPQCQRYFYKPTLDESQINCPSCNTLSRRLTSDTLTGPKLTRLVSEGIPFNTPETNQSNPLADALRKRAQSSQTTSFPFTSHQDIPFSNPLSQNEGQELNFPVQSETSEANHEHETRPRRVIIIQTTIVGGPFGTIIFRTGRFADPSEENLPAEGMQSENAQAQPQSQTQEQQAHEEPAPPLGLLDSLLGWLPSILRRGNQPQGATEQGQGEQEMHLEPTEGEMPNEEPQQHEHPGVQNDTEPGVRMFFSPFELNPNGNMFETLIRELLRFDSEHDGVPAASENDLKRVDEFDYEAREETPLCPVCHEDFKEQERIAKLPCKHEYHNGCVLKWLKMHDACPICRTPLAGIPTPTP